MCFVETQSLCCLIRNIRTLLHRPSFGEESLGSTVTKSRTKTRARARTGVELGSNGKRVGTGLVGFG